jgi:hypothetical protein
MMEDEDEGTSDINDPEPPTQADGVVGVAVNGVVHDK